MLKILSKNGIGPAAKTLMKDLTLNEIYDLEASHSPLVGSRTRVFLDPQERVATVKVAKKETLGISKSAKQDIQLRRVISPITTPVLSKGVKETPREIGDTKQRLKVAKNIRSTVRN